MSQLGAAARFEPLDPADLGSVRAFADRLTSLGRPVDLLVHNAGLAAPPKRLTTADGFGLRRRSDANGWGLRPVAAHPGIA